MGYKPAVMRVVIVFNCLTGHLGETGDADAVRLAGTRLGGEGSSPSVRTIIPRGRAVRDTKYIQAGRSGQTG